MTGGSTTRRGDVRRPAEEFYFAVLDATGLPRGGRPRRVALDALFEASLPIPVDDVKAIYRPLEGERVLACAIDREALVERTRERPDVVSFGPAEWPDFLEPLVEAGDDARDLNLLVDDVEPEAIRAHRRRQVNGAVGAGLLAAGLVVVGIERRIAELDRRRAEADAVVSASLDRAFGPAAPGVQDAQRRAALVGELRRLKGAERIANAGGDADGEAPGAVEVLVRLLSAWPPGLEVHVEALNVTGDALTVRALCPDPETADAFARALDDVAGLSGWRRDPPRFHRGRDVVSVTVRLTRGGEA
ncbi:MAG: hypothetical protein ACF8XB_11095 [Planctomycetota bacterium JB042]